MRQGLGFLLIAGGEVPHPGVEGVVVLQKLWDWDFQVAPVLGRSIFGQREAVLGEPGEDEFNRRGADNLGALVTGLAHVLED